MKQNLGLENNWKNKKKKLNSIKKSENSSETSKFVGL